MKKFLAILILIFTLQTPSQADDIRDFQIEGMSIGDSALDYFSEKELKNNILNVFKNNKFTVTSKLILPSFEVYDFLQIGYRTNDKKYKLMDVVGFIIFKNNINDCFKKQDEIIADLSNMFNNAKFRNKKTFKHNSPTAKSTITAAAYDLNSGDKIMIGCRDNLKLDDYLEVIIRTKEYSYFISNEAYK